MTIGEEVKRLAEAKGFSTQKALAEVAGISQPFVAQIYTGKRPNLTAEVLFKLSRALGVDCSHFAPWFAGEATPAAAPEPAPEPAPPPEPPRPAGKRK